MSLLNILNMQNAVIITICMFLYQFSQIEKIQNVFFFFFYFSKNHYVLQCMAVLLFHALSFTSLTQIYHLLIPRCPPSRAHPGNITTGFQVSEYHGNGGNIFKCNPYKQVFSKYCFFFSFSFLLLFFKSLPNSLIL